MEVIVPVADEDDNRTIFPSNATSTGGMEIVTFGEAYEADMVIAFKKPDFERILLARLSMEFFNTSCVTFKSKSRMLFPC